MTQTQVAGRWGGGEELHTTALLTTLEHKSPVREVGMDDIHTTALPARLKHKFLVREGVTYTQPPCLQDSNTIHRTGAGENYTQPLSLPDSNTRRRSGAGENYTKLLCPQDSNRSRQSGRGGGWEGRDGELHTTALPP